MVAADHAMSQGVPILEDVLCPHGFAWIPGRKGTSSGGYSVGGAFVRGDRKLELHYRYNLGLVTYSIGSMSIDHESLIHAVLPEGERNSYPGFSEDGSLDAFRHLANDLALYGHVFLEGTDTELTDTIQTAGNPGVKRKLP